MHVASSAPAYLSADRLASMHTLKDLLIWNAVGAKTAEILLVVCALHLYTNADS